MFWPVILLLGALYVFVYVLLDRIRELFRGRPVDASWTHEGLDESPASVGRRPWLPKCGG